MILDVARQVQRILSRRSHYRAVFGTPSGEQVLADLKRFCRANDSTAVVSRAGAIDTHAMALAEGRREVFLRIANMINLSDAQMINMKEQADE